MNLSELQIEKGHVHKLLSAGSGDAALLYLYLQSGNDISGASADLRMPQSRLQCAGATLRQLGLWQAEKPRQHLVGERPQYSETDVMGAVNTDQEFRSLYGEVQQQLGRTLNTEELKILLSFVRYLGLPVDVICVLVCYCKDRARQNGKLRNPSLRTIEKEAHAWAEQGIDTIEEAAAYIQSQNARRSQIRQLMDLLQVKNRKLTPPEERYALSWLEMGFPMEVIGMAYERTCLNTGGLTWAYMNKILTRWHESGLHTAEQIKNGDAKPVPKGASGQMGQAELDAIRKVLQEV